MRVQLSAKSYTSPAEEINMYIHTMMGDMGWIDESVGCLGYYCIMMGVLKMYMYNACSILWVTTNRRTHIPAWWDEFRLRPFLLT